MIYFHVYILKCCDGFYYIGHTSNLDQRIAEHNASGYSRYTSVRLPIEVVYVRSFPTKHEAFQVERQIKGWSRQKKEALINNNWPEIIKLSNKRNAPSTGSG